MIRFLAALIITTLIAGGITWLLVDSELLPSQPSFFYQTLLLLPLTTLLIYRFLLKANKPRLFTQLYLLTMVVKLMAYLAYTLAMILKDKEGAASNVIFFLVLYVIFTALEVVFLYRKITPR